MKKNILSRYQRTDDNSIIIDITARSIKDFYNNFDRNTPYIKKELDQELVEYLIDSVAEIGRENFVIHFRLAELEDENLMSRVKTSIYNYFIYLIEREHRKLFKMSRTSLIYFIIGIVILSCSFWLNKQVLGGQGYVNHVLLEGLNVAAWVSLWNAIATFLINWAPHRNLIKLYNRIIQAPISFKTTG